MADPLESAARIDDPIEHTGAMLGAVLGAIAGIVIGVALVVALAVTGPIGIFMMVAGAAVLFSGIGEFLGKKLYKHEAGDIAEGSLTVFVEGPTRNAARTFDKVKCHSGQFIVSGTLTIELEGRKAARVTEETRCDGKIKKGADTVKYGGPSVQVAPKRATGEIAPWFYWTREVLDWATILWGGKGLITGWSKLSKLTKILEVGALAYTGIDKSLGYLSMAFNASGNYAAAKWIGDNITDTWAYKSVGAAFGLRGLKNSAMEARAAQLARRNAALPTVAPSAPHTVATPSAPHTVATPQQPLALPAPQQPLALPAPQQQLALPAPQQQLALPAPKPQLALPAPKPQLALPPPSGGTPTGGGGG